MCFEYCSKCKEIKASKPLDLDNKKAFGPATESDLHLPGHKEAEEISQLLPGDELYHYFDSEASKQLILGDRVVKSKARTACECCMLCSMNSKYPHYGDGAYATTNSSFIAMEDVNPASISQAHGKYYWSKYKYRAVIRIYTPSQFKKYFRTGGVIRSMPDENKLLTRDGLVGHLESEGEAIRIEVWNGEYWDIDEGCCF